MITRWLDEPIAYDGSQLRAHWILQHCGIAGDATVAWRGPCRVLGAEIADLADIDGPGIAGFDMVHVLQEVFSTPDLWLAVHRQRLLAAEAGEVLQELAPGRAVRRTGDDLWIGAGKLSISIATVSPVSALLHFAVNATPGGAPVVTATLADLGIAPREFATALLERCATELRSMTEARAKVRPKGEWR